MNVVYKIASWCIAEGMDNLKHQDQTGFIKGRFINENIRIIYIIVFEKAFDTLSWKFIQETL